MPIRVFPLTGVEVPPTAVFSADPDAGDYTHGGGTDELGTWYPITGYPSAGVKATAVELQVTADDEQTADGQIALVTSALPGIGEVPGSWSGDSGFNSFFGSGNDAATWRFTKFGTWRTDYVTIEASVASGNLVSSDPGTVLTERDVSLTGQFDFYARIRVADWSDEHYGTIVAKRIQAEMRREHLPSSEPLVGASSSGAHISVLFFSRVRRPSDSVEFNLAMYAYCPVSSLGLTNNAWGWVRSTFDLTNGVRFWSSSDGGSWSVVSTVSVANLLERWVGDPSVWTLISLPFVANGTVNYGQGTGGAGFAVGLDGDMSHGGFSADVGGPYTSTLSLDAMESSTAFEWPGGLTNTGRYNSGSSNYPEAFGATVPATRRARYEFTEPVDVNDFRVFVDATSPSSVSVDELLLEYEGGWRGHQIGLYRTGF
jgi:hypothetical protein